MIPKEGKDPASCGSYRPISLLNIDLKLFTKIIATRLQQHLPQLAHVDQDGFVPSREDRDNTVKAINLLHVANTTNTPCVFLGTDAEKAFDWVDWPFMFTIIKHVGFGHTMINWISSIYSGPVARVRANGVLFDPFMFTNGMRQGCPLSPLLSARSLEPFLCKTCLNPDIIIGSSQRKVSAYADDMLFSLTNLLISLSKLLHKFKIYGAL